MRTANTFLISINVSDKTYAGRITNISIKNRGYEKISAKIKPYSAPNSSGEYFHHTEAYKLLTALNANPRNIMIAYDSLFIKRFLQKEGVFIQTRCIDILRCFSFFAQNNYFLKNIDETKKLLGISHLDELYVIYKLFTWLRKQNNNNIEFLINISNTTYLTPDAKIPYNDIPHIYGKPIKTAVKWHKDELMELKEKYTYDKGLQILLNKYLIAEKSKR